MSEKFNNGRGAVICDGCRRMLLEGALASGGFRTVLRPVVLFARYAESDERFSQVDFCSAKCAHDYCQSGEPTNAERQSICVSLAGYYTGLAT